MINIFGYRTGCPACDELKQLLSSYKIEYTFTEVEKGNHPFKTVPMSFSGKQICGGLNDWKLHLKKGNK